MNEPLKNRRMDIIVSSSREAKPFITCRAEAIFDPNGDYFRVDHVKNAIQWLKEQIEKETYWDNPQNYRDAFKLIDQAFEDVMK